MLLFKRNRRGIIVEARTYVLFRKCHPQVLARYYGEICPPETAEALRIAETNVEILHAREYDSNSKADKLALAKARWNLKRTIVSHRNLCCVMSCYVATWCMLS